MAAFATPLAVPEPDFGPLATPKNQYRDHSLEKVARMKGFEDQILEKSMTILNDALAFSELQHEGADVEVPQAWIDEAGGDKARAAAKFRIARAAWKTQAEVPSGIRIAQQTALGIIRARSTEKAGPRVLNIGVVNLSAPIPVFDVIDVEPTE